MSDGDSVTELPSIEYTRNKTTIDTHNHLYIHVKGRSLEECRKHFDEIKDVGE